MYPPNDFEFEEVIVESVSGSEIKREDGWSFMLPKDSSVFPAPGMVARFYGKGIGYAVRGLFLDGMEVFYLSPYNEKIKFHQEIYGATSSELIDRWDSGRSIWSIEMGGMGPGYEQAIQVAFVEILRFMLLKNYPIKSLDNKLYWLVARDEIEEHGFNHESITKFGLSGAMWGAALSLAIHFYRGGPVGVMTDERVMDRHIQVSKNF